jgi:SAM-dependent methyltransferase
MSLLKRLGLTQSDEPMLLELPLSLDATLQPISWTGPLAAYPEQPHVNEHRHRDAIRVMERVSIRAYMQRWKHLLQGRVLDFGAGTQPYRDLLDSQAEYVPFDPGMTGGREVSAALPTPFFQLVMCNQVFQYLVKPAETVAWFAEILKPGGHLVMTYATNWPEVEESDLHRHTKAGMEHLLGHAGFKILDHTRRCELRVGGLCIPLGYGVVAAKVE